MLFGSQAIWGRGGGGNACALCEICGACAKVVVVRAIIRDQQLLENNIVWLEISVF